MSRSIRAIVGALLLTLAVSLAACGGSSPSKPAPRASQEKQIEEQDAKRSPYTPINDVEFTNFNEAQKLYDSPTTIIWCTAFPSNPNAPFITTPIAGKLTSSSVSYRPQTGVIKYDVSGDSMGPLVAGLGDNRSSDGMYHGSPQPYRYGFTPGGVYVDFTNLATFCTTKLTKFQRTESKMAVSVDTAAEETTKRAEAALKDGNKKEAQRILDGLDSGS